MSLTGIPPYGWRGAMEYIGRPIQSIFRYLKLKLLTSKFGDSTHLHFDPAGSIEYVNSVYGDYIKYGLGSEKEIAGKDFLEIGVGDNLGVCINFMLRHARRYTAVDRFEVIGDFTKTAEVYRRLLSAAEPGKYADISDSIALSGNTAEFKNRIVYRNDVALETIGSFLPAESMDIVVSRAVLEHCYNIEVGMRSMFDVLRPGGLAIHKIDFKNHGYMASNHPLLFLAPSNWYWDWQARMFGWPNRYLASEYLNAARSAGFKIRNAFATRLVGMPREFDTFPEYDLVEPDENSIKIIEDARRWLPAKYASRSTKELAVQGLFLVLEKPGAEPVPV